jgi:hypothetical protein
MRMMMTVNMPVKEGNEKITNGKMGEIIESALAGLNPEAAYFVSQGGERTGIIFFDMEDPSQIPLAAEPWFLAFNAKVSFQPAMTLDDFKKAGPQLPGIIEKFG